MLSCSNDEGITLHPSGRLIKILLRMNLLSVFLITLCVVVSSNSWSVQDAVVELRAAPAYDPLAIAYDCLAAISLVSLGKVTLTQRAKTSADLLISTSKVDDGGRSGWPYTQRETDKAVLCRKAGSIDAFGDGTCNPPETPYMIQTGYAVACLAQLYVVTSDAKYLSVAKKAIDDSWGLGTTLSGCNDCFYYWYSYHSNDQGRFVRNTNLIMGLGIAWMYVATGDTKYRDRALAIARAESREIKSGNFGYFGIDDTRYQANAKLESERIENHIPHQVKALKDIGALLENHQALEDSKVMLDAFLNCRNKRCRPDNCKAWAAPLSCKATATIAPCILADRGEPYQSRCEAVLNALPRLNAFQIFLRYSPSDPRKLRPESH